jgi:hypothetical protein
VDAGQSILQVAQTMVAFSPLWANATGGRSEHDAPHYDCNHDFIDLLSSSVTHANARLSIQENIMRKPGLEPGWGSPLYLIP